MARPAHGDPLQLLRGRAAALEALGGAPGRFVLAYGDLLGAPWEWANSKDFKEFVNGFGPDDMLGLQLAFDVTGDPTSPKKEHLRPPVNSAWPSPPTPACGAPLTTTASG
ncbi:MAG TPA: hypothetical protein VMF65_21190 [Acidimicrobiales bacterium]|nr:hypothetical protein [Acidimicrobiales bacterium]